MRCHIARSACGVRTGVFKTRRPIGIAEARLFVRSLEESVLPTQELVGHQRRHEIDRGESVGLRLTPAGFEDGGHSGEAELAERVIEFDQIYGSSPVLRSMRSR